MSILKHNLFFSPDSGGGNTGAIEDRALDKETVIEMLGEEDGEESLELGESDKKDAKGKTEGAKSDSKEKPTGDESPEDDEEEKPLSLEEQLEEDLEEPDEDKLEFAEIPRRKEILAAFPELFKKFPGIEKAIYREQAYSKLLPTIEEAKTAVGKAEILDKYEKEIYQGSTASLLQEVFTNDKEAFAKVVDNYLPTLHKVDQAAYFHTIGNVIKHTIISMVRDSKANDDEQLGEAAAALNKYIFGTTQFTHPQNMSREEPQSDDSKKKEDEISAKEKALIERQYNAARSDLGSRVDGILRKTVDGNIDPNEVMTDYVKGKATKDVLDSLDVAINNDTRFKGIYDRLWEKAFDNDFSKESMDAIKQAYLSKAKTLLPLLIKKARSEALKGIRRTDSDRKDRDRRGPLPVGKSRSSTTLASGKTNSNNNSGTKTVPKGMSTYDYLNSED